MSVTRCGFAAIMGAPNAGKSTLLNRLAGAKLSIVSPKAQTTRFRVLGILMRDLDDGSRAQVLLVDTPGIFNPRRRLDRAMVAAAWSGGADADVVLFIVDAKAGLTQSVRGVAEELKRRGGRLWLVLNKTDLIPPQKLLPLIASLNEIVPFAETFMVSASRGDGVEELLTRIAAELPPGPFLYPEDDLTDLPDRLLAAELVREQVFLRIQQEVPYGVTTETENWVERPDGSVRVEVTIYVARTGQKSILIGAGGQMVRAIGTGARTQLAQLLERPVHLFINVKDRPGWDEETARLRALGLEEDL